MLYYKTANPQKTDDFSQGYQQGDEWINDLTGQYWRCAMNGAGSAQWVSTSAANGVRQAAPIVFQGEATIGSGVTTLLSAMGSSLASLPCSKIWLGAPTTAHHHGTTNAATVLVGIGTGSGGNSMGGIPLGTADAVGFFLPVSDVAGVTLQGTPGDVVEFMIFAP